VLPVRLVQGPCQFRIRLVVVLREALAEPVLLLPAVHPLERDGVAADLLHQVAQQRRREALLRKAWLGMAIAAPSAFAALVPAGGGGSGPAPRGLGTTTPPPVVHVTRTMVAGGMPGWQIALIAAGAALFAAALAVLVDRAWTARRKTVVSAA
jgi:hypothetical protein